MGMALSWHIYSYHHKGWMGPFPHSVQSIYSIRSWREVMKEYLPDVSRQEVSEGLLQTINANWERIVDTVQGLFQRLLENQEIINQIKEVFQGLV